MPNPPKWGFIENPFTTPINELTNQTDWLLYCEDSNFAIMAVYEIPGPPHPFHQMINAIVNNGHKPPAFAIKRNGDFSYMVMLEKGIGFITPGKLDGMLQAAVKWVISAYDAEESGIYDPSPFDDLD
jgi:hypothetical protein